ncbi:4'-phosphopantetheinyl transferase [Streptomyces sp. NPDC096351]|uniref:4'-phosphopantetheinyl transferase family protein n=1 Tax=Streptomyces sp. NPDC096351 TaxID=3366087 RepID=UPI0038081F41
MRDGFPPAAFSARRSGDGGHTGPLADAAASACVHDRAEADAAVSVPRWAGLIGVLLPPAAMSVDVFGDVLDADRYPEARLFADEEKAIAHAVDKRRREFTSVRFCARRALAGLGWGPVALVPGERGAPGWPRGVVGSMTHCAGYRAATVASEADVASLGIDAEPALPLPPGVFEAVTTADERGPLAALALARPGIPWDRLLFCAKEAVYKAWFPLTRSRLDFGEAAVDFQQDGRFRARLLVPGPTVDGRQLGGFTGRWLVRGGIAATAVTVER